MTKTADTYDTINGILLTAELEQSNKGSESLVLCPITSRLCEGDLSYLCEDYGCVRKGGLSPYSCENV